MRVCGGGGGGDTDDVEEGTNWDARGVHKLNSLKTNLLTTLNTGCRWHHMGPTSHTPLKRSQEDRCEEEEKEEEEEEDEEDEEGEDEVWEDTPERLDRDLAPLQYTC